jgi:hypothetical protein
MVQEFEEMEGPRKYNAYIPGKGRSRESLYEFQVKDA